MGVNGLHLLVEATRDNLQLVLARELGEVHSVTRNADCKLRVLLGVLHCIHQHLTIQNVHVEVVCTLRKVTIHHRYKVLDTGSLVNTE